MFRAMKHDKQAEEDDEEEDKDDQDTLFEEEDSHFDVKPLSVMLYKIALFGCQRSIYLLYKVQRR